MSDNRVFENKVHLLRATGKPIPFRTVKDWDDPDSPTETVDLRTEHVLGVLVNAMELTGNQEAIDVGRLSDQVREGRGKDVIVLDTGTHQLVKAKAEPVIIRLWRDSGVAILEFLKEGFQKDTQPATGPGKESKD